MRGIQGEEDFIFQDEEKLVSFMKKNELKKDEDENEYYPCEDSQLWKDVATIWNLNHKFKGSYREDYQIMNNTYDEEGRLTCWFDKYSRVIYNPDVVQEDADLKEYQPVPDFVRWMTTGGEMHYLPLEKVQNLDGGAVSHTPMMFMPSKILDMVFKVLYSSQSSESVLHYISLLSWCPVKEVRSYFEEMEKRIDKEFESDRERDYWAQHELHYNNTKTELES